MDSLDAGMRRKLGDDVTVLLDEEMGKIKLEGWRKRRRTEGSNPLELVKRFTMFDEGSVGDNRSAENEAAIQLTVSGWVVDA